MRPVVSPTQVLVELDGHAIPEALSSALTRVALRRRLSTPAQCELTFENPDDVPECTALVSRESRLRLALTQDAGDLFAGTVTAVELDHGPSNQRLLRVRAYDALHALRGRHTVRAHVQVTLSDLARELVGDLGLSVEATEPGPLREQIVQHRQSDFDLLREQADLCGMYFSLSDGVLHLHTLEGIGEPIPLSLGEDLLEARIELNRTRASRSISTQGWHPRRVDEHDGRADAPRCGRRIEARVSGSESGAPLVNEAVENDEQAQALAQGELDRRAAAEIVLRGVAEGDPRLTPGAKLRVEGLSPAVSGQYVLSEVRHLIDTERGYVTEISTEPPPRRPRPTASSITLGRVTSVLDPDALGRVKVILAGHHDVETEWIPVSLPAAGRDRGVIARPDIDDDVLVAFLPDNPAMAVVIGGLGGAGTPAAEPGTVRDRSLDITIRTTGGQKVRLDDANGTTVIENSEGSRIELSPEGVAFHAKRDLTIEAPGQVIKIRARKIDFEEA